MSRRRSPAPTALRLLGRLTGTPRSRRRSSARSGRSSFYVAGSSSRVRGSRSASLFSRHRAALGLAAFLLFLGAVNLYVLYYRHDTSVPALMELANAGRRAALTTHAGTRLLGPPGTPPVPSRSSRRSRSLTALPDYPRIVEVSLKVGDTVPSALRSHGITGPLADELQSGLRPLLDPGGLGAGQTFSFYYDHDDRLAALDYRLTESSAFHLERVATGSAERFVSTRQEQLLSRQVATVAVVLERDGDLIGALTRAGEQPALAARLAEVFACESATYTDARAGDRFRLVVEKVLLGGSFYRYGRLLAAEYQPVAAAARPQARLRAFLSPTVSSPSAGAAPGATALYFNEAGDSLARAICRAPLLYGKTPGGLTDAAALRPLVHAERGRASIDYPAGAGTPVVAAGAGKVTFAGPRTPGGLTVVISHPGGVETTYQNLGRLTRGLAEGQAVKLRQIIGSVAQPTQPGHGRAPRSAPSARDPKPHLHFVLRVGNKQVDASKWRSPREPALAAAQRANFTNQVTDLMERLAQADSAAPASAPAADPVASRTSSATQP